MNHVVYKWMFNDIVEGILEGVTESIEDDSGWGSDIIYNGWKKICLQIAEDHGRQPILEHDYHKDSTSLDEPFIEHIMKLMGTDTIIGTLKVFHK